MIRKNSPVDGLTDFITSRWHDLVAAIGKHIHPRYRRIIDPEDILQNMYVAARNHADGFPELRSCQFNSYVMRAARSLIVDGVRRETSRGSDQLEYDGGAPSAAERMRRIPAAGRTPSSVVAAGEAIERAIDQLEGLTDSQKQMIRLHFMGGLSYEDIAGMMGGTAQAVRCTILRGRTHLAELMGPAERYFRDA